LAELWGSMIDAITAVADAEVSHDLPPTRRGQATRQKLLEAAETAFGEYGYERTRVADIVRLAGVSHGNFYRHFADKDAVLQAVLDGLYQELRRSTRRRASGGGLPSEAELINRNIQFFHEYAKHRHLLRVAREAAARGEHSSFLQAWLGMRKVFVEANGRWLASLSLPKGTDPMLLAEALGAMTEQLAYVQIGLARTLPRSDELDGLGRICGQIWHRAISGSAA
jgi:AcrR family transcriptional regulator